MTNKKMESKKSIFLIGYMGSGKTTVGKAISGISGFTYHDMDNEIEASEGIPIRRIFIVRGEHHFRNQESRLLDEYCKQSRLVVSCGGGIILDPFNVEILKNQCFTVFLEGSVEALFERVKNDENRPYAYLDGEEEKERLLKFCTLYEQRKPHYLEASSRIISIDGKEPAEIAAEIVATYQES